MLEKTEVDPRTGAYLNRDLADYLVPTHADIAGQQAIIVEDDDPAVNPEGVKGPTAPTRSVKVSPDAAASRR